VTNDSSTASGTPTMPRWRVMGVEDFPIDECIAAINRNIANREAEGTASASDPLLVTDGLDFINTLHQQDQVAEALSAGVVFEYGPNTPELRPRCCSWSG
jgi:hypothetical protein